MPSFIVTDPQTGRKLRLTGDSPPTEQELESIFSAQGRAKSPADLVSQIPTGIAGVTEDKFSQAAPVAPPTVGEQIVGAGETALTMATGATGGALGFLGGAAKGIGEEIATGQFGQGIAEQEAMKGAQALTYAPRTEAGRRQTGALGEVASQLIPLGPLTAELGIIGEASRAAMPTIGRTALKATGISSIAEKLKTSTAKNLLREAAPTTEGLKQAARGVYNELDNIGATVNPSRITGLSNKLQVITKKEGFNKRIHPKVAAALDEIASNEGKALTVSEIDTLRKVARGAAKSIEPDEARLGGVIVENIDDMLDQLKPSDFIGKNKTEIGTKFRDARQLWSRAKKSELIEDAFERAKNQASGFENGIRTQFRSILNNKKKIRGFSQEELNAMRKVVRGGAAENTLKALGKFGFNEGQATNVLMGSLGVAGGAAIGGAPGAVAVPLIGQVSRGLAQKLTRNNAMAANAIAKAGKDGMRITREYLKAIPKAERNVGDLTELLMKPGVNLETLRKIRPSKMSVNDKLIADAAFFADFMQTQQEQQEAPE